MRRVRAAVPGLQADGTVHPRVSQAIDAERGRGAALGGSTARWAAAALGAPVRNARLHTDARADALARSVAARAFTVSNSVFFAAGQYRPHTVAGRRLLAHELAHVVQQHGAPRGGPLRVSQPGDRHERAADAAADAAVD